MEDGEPSGYAELDDVAHLLERCRASFGPAGRHFPLRDMLTYLQVPRPSWCDQSDVLGEFFRGYKRLLATGDVIWGHIVQANELLFEDGPRDHPAEMVYAADIGRQPRPSELARIAARLYDLKGKVVDDPEAQAVADHLANETTRAFGKPVPESLSPGLLCETTPVLVARKHIPRRRLCCELLPIILGADRPRLAMVLPARYWPPELVKWWAGRA